MNDDLFPNKGLSTDQQPLAYRMRPKNLDEFEGQEHVVGKGAMLRTLIENKTFSSMIFFGPSGCGKTALVKIIAAIADMQVVEINAVTAGVAELRKALEQARYLNETRGKKLLVMVDEIHHFNRTQQDALLPAMESGSITLIGLTTENPYFYVNNAIISRAMVFEFKKLETPHIVALLRRALSDATVGYGTRTITADDAALEHIAAFVNGDARYALNILEHIVNAAQGTAMTLTTDAINACLNARGNIRYDKAGDYHYDVISAFIKSMRGSDPDATLYWLAVMLSGGEDIRFIARRIAICAAEDVGLAAPYALCVAQAAWDLVERVGMPEARIILAEAAVTVATSPKSNASYLGIEKALGDVKNGTQREVPNHLKDANLDGEGKSGHGVGYKYPHDYPRHFVEQRYLNERYTGTYYRPTIEGRERDIQERLKTLWNTDTERLKIKD